jgi:UDP-N-acetylglucosamine:LPS N-acetylglucosamine transferase
MRIMITGGGTGGHTSPAIAVFEELSRRDPQLRTQWVGCKGKIEERICRQRAIPFRSRNPPVVGGVQAGAEPASGRASPSLF